MFQHFPPAPVDETLRDEMNCHLTFSLAISMTLSTLAIPLRAANRPRAGMDSQNTWFGPTTISKDSCSRPD